MPDMDYEKMQKEIEDLIRKHPFQSVPTPLGAVGQLWQVDAKGLARRISAIVEEYVRKAE